MTVTAAAADELRAHEVPRPEPVRPHPHTLTFLSAVVTVQLAWLALLAYGLYRLAS